MPLFAPPLRLLPMWCSCCSCCCGFRPVIHRVAMFRGLHGQNFGGGDGVVASRSSPCRRGLAHLRGRTTWFRVAPALDSWSSFQFRVQRRRCAGTSLLPRSVTVLWRRLRSGRERQAVSEQLRWLSYVQWRCKTAHRSRGEVLSANCDSRTLGNGRRNRQAANGAPKKRATDLRQGRR